MYTGARVGARAFGMHSSSSSSAPMHRDADVRGDTLLLRSLVLEHCQMGFSVNNTCAKRAMRHRETLMPCICSIHYTRRICGIVAIYV